MKNAQNNNPMNYSEELKAAWKAQVTEASFRELMDAVANVPSWHPISEMITSELNARMKKSLLG